MARVERTGTRIVGFQSAEMDFQLMRSLGAASFRGGEPGEVFAARSAIKDDPYAWPPAFSALGDRVRAAGEEAAHRDRRVTARDHLLRASMYYRSAEYFADPFGSDGLRWGRASRETFLEAAKYMAERIEAVEIPFEGIMLPGYFMTPVTGAAEDGRTVLVLTGFDGTGEELYFQTAKAGLERGFNVLAAEGPGQVGCLRFRPTLTFRPDYEKPIGAMIDFALARRDVAAERLALYGISFGGYFVIRAGAHDPRIRALIVNSPIVDLRAYMAGFIGPEAAQSPPPIKLAEVDEIPDTEFPRVQKLSFKSACRRFGVDSFAGWLNRLAEFTAGDGLANIKCPTLAMAGAGEGGETVAQFERYCREVSGPVTRRLFTADEGADMHCQLGNLSLSNAVVYDWLGEVFRQ